MKLDPREFFDAEELHGERDEWHDCACCLEGRHVSEFAEEGDEIADALAKRKLGPVCTACADEYTLCATCDEPVGFDETWRDDEGAFFCPDCSTHLPDNARCAAADDARKAMIGG